MSLTMWNLSCYEMKLTDALVGVVAAAAAAAAAWEHPVESV
jgi:hypothetical protein